MRFKRNLMQILIVQWLLARERTASRPHRCGFAWECPQRRLFGGDVWSSFEVIYLSNFVANTFAWGVCWSFPKLWTSWSLQKYQKASSLDIVMWRPPPNQQTKPHAAFRSPFDGDVSCWLSNLRRLEGPIKRSIIHKHLSLFSHTYSAIEKW